MKILLANRFIRLVVDERGRIASLRNELTKTELIAFPLVSDAWRLVVPSGRHTIDFVLGSKQKPGRMALAKQHNKQSLTISYAGVSVGKKRLPIKVVLVFTLPNESPEILANVEIHNQSDRVIDEVESPIIGGIGALPMGRQKALNLVVGTWGWNGPYFADDILHRQLPVTGCENNHFTSRHDTAMFDADSRMGCWLDLWNNREGLYLGYHEKERDGFVKEERLFAFKIEKHPKMMPVTQSGSFPPDTPRWMRVAGLHVPRIQPGSSWSSPPVHIQPHAGDWHKGADVYSSYAHKTLTVAPAPAWTKDFVGWTEILGKTYLGEVFHDYAGCADQVVRDKKITGLDLVFYYGHSKLGSEGGDFDHSPAADLGGNKGFRQMIRKLHANGIRVFLLDHVHWYINSEIPEYKRLRIKPHVALDKDGKPRVGKWWKETWLSCRRMEGPTPIWHEICPTSKVWLEHYLRHVTKMIELGVDGLELDVFAPDSCFAKNHGHPPGANMLAAKLEFMRTVRRHAKRLNPDFLIVGETTWPEAFEVLDMVYFNRHQNGDNGRIYRYLFPELTRQTALVGNYGYDQVNKALMLGIGIETEVWGLRTTALAACPELARYIGEVNRFKRRYEEILINGHFRDTIGAAVTDDLPYSVIEGPGKSRALIVRNPTAQPKEVRARLTESASNQAFLFWRPFAGEKTLRKPQISSTLKSYEAAVLLALDR